MESLLRQLPTSIDPGADCPRDSVIAMYVDGGLEAHEHGAWSRHFADCDYCLARLGALSRAREADTVPPLPEIVRHRARRLAREHNAERRFGRLAPAWAAAAVLVVALGIVFFNDSRRPPGGDSLQTVPARETRYIEPLAAGPVLRWPLEGTVLAPDAHEFNWTAIPESRYYELRIVSDSGDLIWQQRVTDTRWILPPELNLEIGADYFVRVDAWLNDASALSSDYVLFRYGDRR
jgi:hypothetical protein